jgi:hypothetical protein
MQYWLTEGTSQLYVLEIGGTEKTEVSSKPKTKEEKMKHYYKYRVCSFLPTSVETPTPLLYPNHFGK